MLIILHYAGVHSVSIEGESKDQVAVTGDGIDSVCLTSRLRKKFCYATILSIADVKASKNKDDDAGGTKEKETTSTENLSVPFSPYSYANCPCPCPSYQVVYCEPPNPSSCSIV